MFDTIMKISTIQQEQYETREELRYIRFEQKAIDKNLPKLADKVKLVEDSMSLVLPLKTQVEQLSQSSEKLVPTCSLLESFQDELENQS